MEEVNYSGHQKQEVGGGLVGDLTVQYVEGEWRDQTFEELEVSGPLEGKVVVALWVA